MKRSWHYNAWYCEWKACERLEDCWLSPSPSDQQTKSEVQRGGGWREVEEKENEMRKSQLYSQYVNVNAVFVLNSKQYTYINIKWAPTNILTLQITLSNVWISPNDTQTFLMYEWLKFTTLWVANVSFQSELNAMRKQHTVKLWQEHQWPASSSLTNDSYESALLMNQLKDSQTQELQNIISLKNL